MSRTNTTTWTTIRTYILQRDPTCQLQLPGCTGQSQTADHINPWRDGGTNHPNNLRGSCHHCNQKRKAQWINTDTTQQTQQWK